MRKLCYHPSRVLEFISFQLEVKQLKTQFGSCHAHEVAAKKRGFNTYAAFLADLKKEVSNVQ